MTIRIPTRTLGRLIARTRRRAMLAMVLVLGTLVALTAAGTYAQGASAAATHDAPVAPGQATSVRDNAADVARLLERARRADAAWAGLDSYWDEEVAPIERVLRRYKDDPDLARRVAVALVREARAVDLEPRLLLAVLLVENPWLNPTARSPVGAVGLMQVMPLHRGNWRACPGDLEEIDSNICYGARIFAHYYRRSGGDVERALLRYNGCVNGTNTPDCHLYPYKVFARAGRASVLAWLEPTGGGAPAAAAP